ncbi:P-loop ATPase, Sll1717 family [Saccharothrix violaceirubra]|uniref:Uncharacterized protein n=1 Tax=Saccharothrix violaceirubra TaxID=413306 RepID=A0A7W7T5G1_9PSEU|nr:hypothetical protein [Saccharothrix violaceirubra]MBB4966626.1 hypothetical protein [Saccharothrix violaceirubra]
MAERESDVTAGLDHVLTAHQPFGPIVTEDVVHLGPDTADRLFDRSNRSYRQAAGEDTPTYIIGRKGAGKTAFLMGSNHVAGPAREVLRTENVYHEMLKVLTTYSRDHEPFVDQRAEIWQALFEHVAMLHAWSGFDGDDRRGRLNTIAGYLGRSTEPGVTGTAVAERFLVALRRRLLDHGGEGLSEAIANVTHDGQVPFGAARAATLDLLAERPRPLLVVMDNLEDLHLRLPELTPALTGLFRCAGTVIARHHGHRPYGVQICLPSELFDKIHELAAAPEKDLRGRYLKIYWTAPELLRLTANRLVLFLRTHHPEQLAMLERRAAHNDEPDPAIAVLRAALPDRVRSGLDIDEDPLAYLLRHTQLLPRHLIQILNSVFSRRDRGSTPWDVTPAAVLAGTRYAEHPLVAGVLAAYQTSYPLAGAVLRRLAGRIDLSFPARGLHRVYNQQGIRKLTGLDFDEFLAMLFTLGVLGVRFDQTGRYNKAHFQYTFDYDLIAREDADQLCVHPLFTRYLLERSLPRLREAGAHATYPYGCDPRGEDYRDAFGYLDP